MLYLSTILALKKEKRHSSTNGKFSLITLRRILRIVPWTYKMLWKVLEIRQIVLMSRKMTWKFSVDSGFSNMLEYFEYGKNRKPGNAESEQKAF